MTRPDENDLTDEELLEMWSKAEPVELADPPASTSVGAEGRPKQRSKPSGGSSPSKTPRSSG